VRGDLVIQGESISDHRDHFEGGLRQWGLLRDSRAIGPGLELELVAQRDPVLADATDVRLQRSPRLVDRSRPQG
jgi:hypothetical protein